MSATHDVTPRLAATTSLVRARGDQPELLLLKRGEHARFMPNAYVFAGGALDLNDESADVYALCQGLDDAHASRQLQLPETRLQVSTGALSIAELCGRNEWRLAVDKLTFYSHWITPPGSLRFDTRFFLCAAPPKQTPCLAGSEMSELVWRTAPEALCEHADRKLLLMYPTRMILEEIAGMQGIDELFEFAGRPRK